LSNTDKIEACIQMVNERNRATDGRNNFVFRLACLSIEHSVNADSILSYCLSNYISDDFTKAEIEKTVSSAAKRVTFGKYTDAQLSQYLKHTKPTPSVVPTKKVDIVVTDDMAFEDDKRQPMNEAEHYINDRYQLRFNYISNEIEVAFKRNKPKFTVLNANDLLRELNHKKIKASDKSLKVSLTSSFVPRYNPITAYFENLPTWKGDIDHIANLASYVKAKDKPFFNAQFKKMLVRVVACAMGIAFNKQCFTFVGGQNCGKTSFVRFLIPTWLREYYKENIGIDKDG
jgi:hypothetical protein